MKDLTNGNIYKTFFLFAIPLVMTGLLTQAYNIIDLMIAGKLIGSDGLAAVGATSALISFLSAIFWGYGNGFGIYIARLFGEKNYKRIKLCIYNNCIMIIMAAAIIGGIMIVFRDYIFNFLCIDETIRSEACIYFVIYIAGLFLIILNSIGMYIMNALGSSEYPFGMSLISMLLNIAGNIFSVAVLKIGVAGLAISTVFAAFVVDIFYFVKLKKNFLQMGVSREAVCPDMKQIKSSLKYSLPVMLQQVTMYAASMAVMPVVNGMGSMATSGYTIALKVYDVNATIFQNSSKTLSNYTAQCIGVGKHDNIKKGLRVGFVQGVLFLLPVLVICVFFSKNICLIFFPTGYVGEDLDFAVLFVRNYLPFVIFNLVTNLFHAFFRGVAAMRLLVESTFIGTAVRIALSILLAAAYSMTGIYAGWVISWAAECVFVLAVYFCKH